MRARLVYSVNNVRPRSSSLSNSASFYTISNNLSLTTLIDSPPSPHSSSPRIPPKPKQQQQHHHSPNPLALTPTHNPSNPPPSHLQSLPLSLPYYPPIVPGFSNALIFPQSALLRDSDPAHRRARRKRLSRIPYTLQSGAYGIPKKHSHAIQSHPDLPLATPIGEDAYFVRDDAVGVADGIGGWARARSGRPPITLDNVGLGPGVSPSAMFATRMMHCVSDELKIKRDDNASRLQLLSSESPFEEDDDYANLEQELESQLEDLEEGIDILQVLERAYERTWKGHVHEETGERVLLGGATVMVAALDWPDQVNQPATIDPKTIESLPEPAPLTPGPEPNPVLKIAQIGDCMGMLVRGNDIVWRSEEMWWDYNTPVQLSPPPLPRLSSPAEDTGTSPPLMEGASTLFTSLFPAKSLDRNLFSHASPASTSSLSTSPRSSSPFPCPTPPSNHPQPVNLITPKTTARVITLPVQTDDILVLASDGLSDNLWDEDVLDEVLRFKGQNSKTARLSPGLPTPPLSPPPPADTSQSETHSTLPMVSTLSSSVTSLLQRHTLATKLSEALCSRAKRVSERRHESHNRLGPEWLRQSGPGDVADGGDWYETPFGRRAQQSGKIFRGGKRDDISVVVAVVSPPALAPMPTL